MVPKVALINGEKKVDIHNYETALKSTYRRLETAKINEQNRNDIREFGRLAESMGLNKGRVSKFVYSMTTLARQANKPFREMTRKDAESLMIWLNDNPTYSPATKSDMKKIFKRFMK
ncbi:MAG: hypothetical protein JRM72_00120 [Nitrososphaerota archaeon]|jgi:hypothetical protein|nr:hypothetical protein [Nitrososphaerota archaeon]